MNKNMTFRIKQIYDPVDVISCGLTAIMCSFLFTVFGHAAVEGG